MTAKHVGVILISIYSTYLCICWYNNKHLLFNMHGVNKKVTNCQFIKLLNQTKRNLLNVNFLQFLISVNVWSSCVIYVLRESNNIDSPLIGMNHERSAYYSSLCGLTFRLLMSYIYGAPILDVSRSHTTTQHSR